MAEEHRCGGHRLCANNCGFFGSPATLNLCSRCYRDYEQASSAKIALEKSLSSSSSAAASAGIASASAAAAAVPADFFADSRGDAVAAAAEEEAEAAAARPRRCSACRKRVGLTGFRCRCGVTFCGAHRYPEQHGCSFDFRAAGREAIAKANPLVKGEKLEKI